MVNLNRRHDRKLSKSYSIATDGSTDQGAVKLYPVLLRTFDENVGKKGGKSLQFQFDDLLIDIWYYMDKSSLRHQEIIKLQAQHGIEIRKILKHVPTRCSSLLKTHRVAGWRQLGFKILCGGANDITRHLSNKKHKDNEQAEVHASKTSKQLTSFFGKKEDTSVINAEKGGKSLQFQFDDLLIDIWYYMDKSSLWHQEIIKLQAQHGIEIRKILKHVPTRWLSLGTALQRLLENWQPLTEFFKAQASTGTTKVAKVGKKRELSPSASTRNPKKLRTCDDTKVKGNTTSEMPTTSSSSSKTA
eukprot:XP_011675278.1 PREDICTED: uncharacterized protein LOC105443617 [Strongylocentrotus purpuratus]